jgi:hypothetical protein
LSIAAWSARTSQTPGYGLLPQGCRPDSFQGDLDGLGVEMPHEGSDVLNLSAAGAMFAYFTCEFNCRPKLIRQRDGLKLAGRQADQLFAQALQSPVLLFFPGSAFIIRLHLPAVSFIKPVDILLRRRARLFPTEKGGRTIQLILRPNCCSIRLPGA